jgi:hypothetical protein
MAWVTILASTWRGLAPSAIRTPISRVRRDTLIDISAKSPMADRNNTSAWTPADAPIVATRPESRCQIHSPSDRASGTDNPASTPVAITGRRAANAAGLPRRRTRMMSGDTVAADAA